MKIISSTNARSSSGVTFSSLRLCRLWRSENGASFSFRSQVSAFCVFISTTSHARCGQRICVQTRWPIRRQNCPTRRSSRDRRDGGNYSRTSRECNEQAGDGGNERRAHSRRHGGQIRRAGGGATSLKVPSHPRPCRAGPGKARRSPPSPGGFICDSSAGPFRQRRAPWRGHDAHLR